MGWKIGVDGGGSKTECILLGPDGRVAARHTAPGCNPTLVGQVRAAQIAADALRTVRGPRPAEVEATMLCMAGSRAFWKDFAAGLAGHGAVVATDDSLPVLELAVGNGPGLVLHAGTGSFVAARTPDGAAHYAGGLGWRYGDEGSGYDIGRRGVGRALLEFQGSAPASALGPLVRERSGSLGASDVSSLVHHASTPAEVASLAPAVLALAAGGYTAAGTVVATAVRGLLQLAVSFAGMLFPGARPDSLRAGVSGPVLNHPFAFRVISEAAPFPLASVTESPIEGVRRLLARRPG